MRSINMIVVHCSDSGASTTVEDIDSWHKARGWKKIGYHQVIYPDGSIHRGREDDEIGAHAEGDNLFSIGICLVGRKDFPQIQLDSLRTLVLEYMESAKIPSTQVFGHYERPSGKAQGKTCPNLDMNAFRGSLK